MTTIFKMSSIKLIMLLICSKRFGGGYHNEPSIYDDMVLIKQALIERDRKIYGLKQHNRNLEDKLGRIGGYHYGNPKQ